MDLFDFEIDKTKNWLPHDGTVNYYGKLFSQKKADFYLNELLETIERRNDEATTATRRTAFSYQHINAEE